MVRARNTRNVMESNHSSTNCRDEDGVTVGLIDALMSIARILAKRDMNPDSVQEALKDLASDEDIAKVLDEARRI